ncbi:MAG: ribose 5-phosphate isomerase B [Chitinophagaceae bacterium]
MTKTISIGNDHAGTDYKLALMDFVQSLGYDIINRGTDAADSVDYPDFAHAVAEDVSQGKALFGILLCGSANGVCMTANKHADIRAALCWQQEISLLARQHNDANIICLPARFCSIEACKDMVATFLNTPFEGGRHQNRVEKIACCS